MTIYRRIVLSLWGLAIALPLVAQQASPDPVKIGTVTVSGSVRTRGMFWDWFDGNANNQYAYSESLFRVAFSQAREKLEWKLELAAPVLLGLPDGAVAAGAQGQFGFGATYFAANNQNRNVAMIFAKQGYVKVKFNGSPVKQSLLLGRMEFNDGAEVTPKDATLAALKRDRISQRLLGAFGFSAVGRSIDGLQYVADNSRTNFTFLAARPTRGAFQVDGWGEVNTNVFYSALTHETGSAQNSGEWRIFGLGYNDYRSGVLKTDNRPQSLRAADHGHINIWTAGGHYLRAMQTNGGTFDVLLWGAVQGGSWGNLTQRAAAFATEAGWQPTVLRSIKPWIRGGYNYGSGDHNPNDSTHGSFFQVLPTPRPYARFPFFNMMNNRDAFGEIILRPAKPLTIRADVHSLALADKNDLWYSGGGIYQPWTFGYTGRPSNGQRGLATLYDASADYALNLHVSLAAYYGYASGKLVAQALYPKGKNGNLGYLELNYRF
jgi:alginate export protein